MIPPQSTKNTTAIVIGAGLAGASTAYALAQQGWQVQVLDAATAAAQGASALPVGLMAGRKGGAKSAQNKAGNAQPDWDGQGMACTRRWLDRFTQQGLLQQGQDWQNCGTAYRASMADANTDADANTEAGQDWQWQADACWVKPQALVAACLKHPNIRCDWQAQINSINAISSDDAGWQVQAADGRLWQAASVVLAASVGSLALLQALPLAARGSALWRVQSKTLIKSAAGQAIFAPWSSAWNALLPLPEHTANAAHAASAPHACNGHGHFLPAVAGANGQEFWLSGATYLPSGSAAAANTAGAQTENLSRLCELLPALAAHFQAQDQQGQIQRFASVRCATATGFPLLQTLAPGLCLCTGFGSRGLSYAPLAAEFLAEQMGAFSLPSAS